MLLVAIPITREVSAEPSASSPGRFENSAAWFVAGKPPRPVGALGKDLHIDGWIFFGSDRVEEMFGDTSHRKESLPAYIQRMAVARGPKTARLDGYARIPVPGESALHQGTPNLRFASPPRSPEEKVETREHDEQRHGHDAVVGEAGAAFDAQGFEPVFPYRFSRHRF